MREEVGTGPWEWVAFVSSFEEALHVSTVLRQSLPVLLTPTIMGIVKDEGGTLIYSTTVISQQNGSFHFSCKAWNDNRLNGQRTGHDNYLRLY